MRSRSQSPPETRSPSGADELGRVAELFGMVADRTRAGVLYALSDAGELTLAELATAVDAPERSVLGALRPLRVARMIQTRRRSDDVLYSLRGSDVRDLLHKAAVNVAERPAGPVRRRAQSRMSVRR